MIAPSAKPESASTVTSKLIEPSAGTIMLLILRLLVSNVLTIPPPGFADESDVRSYVMSVERASVKSTLIFVPKELLIVYVYE